jgi:GntR family transcriptional regulator, histidine utilization repressor
MSQVPQTQQPLYAQIKTAIERRIQEDKWQADFQLPGEEELAVEFGSSRLTVRRALKELQNEGLLIRIQGRGTFVVGPRVPCAIFDLPDISEEIEYSGGVHTSEVIALRAIDRNDSLAALLPMPPGAVLFHSRILHKEDGTPLQIEDRFVNSLEAPGYLEQDFSRISPHAYLLGETEVTAVENSIRAVRADAESLRFLEIASDQPCLLIDRRTWRDKVPVTRSRFLYPGDRYRLRSSHEAATSSRPPMSGTFDINPSSRRIR